MFEDSLQYALLAVSWQNFAAMLLGVVIGLVIGAIPGLSPPMAIALMIPVSFNMEPATALIMLVSVYAAGIYGGSFSAILLRTPGTSASAASARTRPRSSPESYVSSQVSGVAARSPARGVTTLVG